MIDLSSAESIEKNVNFGNDGFGFVETVGGMVTNPEFGSGYIQFGSGKTYDSRYHVWEALSAVGQDIGDALYTNVRHYIDKVCDVDSCGVQQLKSIMDMLGFEYTIFDNVEMYPIEVLNLMNVLTVSKKYYMTDGLLRNTLLSALYEDGSDAFGDYDRVISGDVCTLGRYLSSHADQYHILSGMDPSVTIDGRTIDDGERQDGSFQTFARRMYANLILDFLTMKYGDVTYVFNEVVENERQSTKYFIDSETRNSISSFDMRDYKVRHGIDVGFDEQCIADDINDGKDSLDNYCGQELVLLSSVIQQRTKSKQYNGKTIPGSRYAYYTNRKVVEYRDFILNKYYSDSIQSSKDIKIQYGIDRNYYLIYRQQPLSVFNTSGMETGEIDKMTPIELLQKGIINGRIFNSVVNSLVRTTQYIIQLRNKIRLQVRKNYMRGTNNLLLYIINEYLLDYKKHTELSDIREYFSHEKNTPQMDNLKIVEYYDQTEYFNQQTDSDAISHLGGKTVSPRFWDGNLGLEPRRINEDNSLELNQIQDFYVNAMNLRMSQNLSSPMNDVSVMNDFLDTVYSSGASRMSFNEKGFVNMQMSRGGEWTDQMYEHLVRLSSNYVGFNGWLSVGKGDYLYDSDTTVSDQISDVTENYIFAGLSDIYLSGITDAYDRFTVSAYQISSNVMELDRWYYDELSGSMSYYFTKPDIDSYPDCFDGTTGEYLHDYYWGNPSWDNGNLVYVYDKLSWLLEYCNNEENIRNYPLIDTTYGISAQLMELSSDHYSEIVTNIQKLGYIDLESEYFTEELDSTKSFCNDKISERRTYLNNLLNQMKEEAQNLRSTYATVKSAFDVAIAQYKNQTGLTELEVQHFASAPCSYGKNTELLDGLEWGCRSKDSTVTVGGQTYHGVKDAFRGYYVFDDIPIEDKTPNCVYFGPVERYTINLDGDFETIAPNMKDFLSQCTKIEIDQYTEDSQKYVKISNKEYSYMDNGVYASISDAIDSLNKLTASTTQLKQTINSLFGDGSLDEGDSIELFSQINEIIKFLNDNGFDLFTNDLVMKQMRNLLSIHDKIDSKFGVIQKRYSGDIYGNSNQSEYLKDCKADSQLTFRNLQYICKFTDKKDGQNRSILLDEIGGKIREYIVEQDRTVTLTEDMAKVDMLPQTYVYSGKMVEQELQSILEFLEMDVVLKTIRQNNIINMYKDEIWRYLDVIEDEISSYLGRYVTFDDAVSGRMEEVNFYDKETYLRGKSMYLEYGGQRFCYYPYMNHKNIEHPSYQIHPFLWNFVEYDGITQKLCREFYNIDVEEFEKPIISSRIHDYIGRFGNTVNEWKNGTLDFSGYTTRYENSSHQYHGNYSEVVDFDGTFYPNAVRDLKERFTTSTNSLKDRMTRERLVTGPIGRTLSGDISKYDPDEICEIVREKSLPYTQLSDGLQEEIETYMRTEKPNRDVLLQMVHANMAQTFYERYYSHLEMTLHDATVEYESICEYLPQISAITEDNYLSDVYDIYRYCRDVNGNAITLLKRYGREDASYIERRNTPGQLWMRMKDHPFSFPAFTGRHPAAGMTDMRYCFPTVWRLSRPYPSYDPSEISDGLSSCEYFFDFTSSNDGYSIHMVAYPTDKGSLLCAGCVDPEDRTFNTDESIPFDYENSMIINGYSNNVTDESGNSRMTLYQYDRTEDVVDYIRSAYGKNQDTHLSSFDPVSGLPTEDTENYAYIGSYNKGLQNTYHLYALKRYMTDGTVKLGRCVRIMWMQNGILKNSSIVDNNVIRGQVSGDVCFSYDSDTDSITLAYLVENGGDDVTTDGHTFEYGNSKDMNSNDKMTTNVKLSKFSNSGITLDDKNVNTVLNTNADMSYIASKPGFDRPTDIRRSVLTTEYRNVELLGKSRDIESRIEDVNTNVNPYIDYDYIRNNQQFGRVYEEYDEERDDTLRMYGNQTINFKNQLSDTTRFEWIQRIDEIGDADDVKIIVLNRDSLGKSVYVAESLNNLIGNWVPAFYDQMCESETRLSGTVYDIRVNGLSEQNANSLGSNRIDGISSVSIGALSSEDGLSVRVRFMLDPSEKPPEYTYVRNEQIQILEINPNNIGIFEQFHILDRFGMVYAKKASGDLITKTLNGSDGWTIVLNPQNRYTYAFISNKLREYYDDMYGNRRELDSVDMTKYDCLSDVWLLRKTDGLSFKYSEQDYFQISSGFYYFPGLNCRFPKTMGQYAYEQLSYSNNLSGNDMGHCFTDSDVFVVENLDSGEIMDSIGTVGIECVEYEQDCRLVDESYLNYDTVGGITLRNCEKCPVDDEESMYDLGFYRMFEDATEFQDGTTLHDTTAGDDEVEQVVKVKGVEGYVDDFSVNSIDFDVSRDSVDISRFIRIYANYRKTERGTIQIYFNYFNFINTPFVELRSDGNVYPLIQDGSYLRLDSGEDGILDIYVQMKYYSGGVLFGQRMIRVASYHIYNVSDDKPKFMLLRTYLAGKGDAETKTKTKVDVRVYDCTIDMRGKSSQEVGYGTMSIGFRQCGDVRYPFTVDVEYPSAIISLRNTSGSAETYSYSLDGTKVVIRVSGPTTRIDIPVKTSGTKQKLEEYLGQSFPCFIGNCSAVAEEITTGDGYVTVNG